MDSEEDSLELLIGGNPTSEFYDCLVELFGRFDVNSDNVLCETELRTFSRAANADAREFSEEELEQIREFFTWEDGLTLEGWLQMYVSQARNDEDGTWQDLKKLGYNSQLELPQVCEGAKFILTRNPLLQLRLEEFATLASSGDIKAFVAAFVPSSVTMEEQEEYVETLQSKAGVHLANLLAELQCCISGKNIIDVEGDQDKGPVTFNFWSPVVAGGEESFSFVCEAGQWHSEEIRAIQAVPERLPSVKKPSQRHPYCKKKY